MEDTVTRAELETRITQLAVDITILMDRYLSQVYSTGDPKRDIIEKAVEKEAETVNMFMYLRSVHPDAEQGGHAFAFLALATAFKNALIASAEKNLVNRVDQ